MSKFSTEIVSSDCLLRAAQEQWNNAGDFPELFTYDFEIRDDVHDKWFVVQWPDHCVTRQHLSDATIHGPFESREEAESYR